VLSAQADRGPNRDTAGRGGWQLSLATRESEIEKQVVLGNALPHLRGTPHAFPHLDIYVTYQNVNHPNLISRLTGFSPDPSKF
jgi:hypothetical protein